MVDVASHSVGGKRYRIMVGSLLQVNGLDDPRSTNEVFFLVIQLRQALPQTVALSCRYYKRPTSRT